MENLQETIKAIEHGEKYQNERCKIGCYECFNSDTCNVPTLYNILTKCARNLKNASKQRVPYWERSQR